MALNRSHKSILDEYVFEKAGPLKKVLGSDEYDGIRVIYAITDPEHTKVVYIGDTEQGRDVRARLRSHLKDREKVGLVEETSIVYIHIMVTEYLILDEFEEKTGTLPVLNKRKSAKHAS